MSKYKVDSDSLTAVADAIRTRTGKNNSLEFPDDFIDEIKEINDDKWIRPADWPNLDNIVIDNNFEGLYLTYDLRKTPGYAWIGLSCVLLDSVEYYNIDRGHLENGIFIVDESYSLKSNTVFRQDLDNNNGNVQLWRVTVINSHIKQFKFRSKKAVNDNTTACNALQPCVERIGRLDYITNLTSSHGTHSNYGIWGTQWLERDAVKINAKTEITNMSLSNTWTRCINLQELDLSDWNVNKWNITNFTNTFLNCAKLKKLDLTSFANNAFEVSSAGSMFGSCYSLQEIDMTGWDYSHFTLSGMNYATDSLCNLITFKGTATLGSTFTNAHVFSYAKFYKLENFDGFAMNINITISNFTHLTHASLINILNALELVETVTTITLGPSLQMRLTDAEIAIATQKGWTVA